MNKHIEKIKQTIEPLRAEIINHPVYSAIKNINHLQVFMQYHVYAVWDFMSLLKTLQNNLTCTSVPWFPVGQANTRYLINEIVVGEEADVDLYGNRKSHFELYLNAMAQCGANTQPIQAFTQNLKHHGNLQQAFAVSNTPAAAAQFVNYTFQVINGGKSHVQSAVFTFGREDLIPGMFLTLVKDMHQTFPQHVSIFKYYLERHIEVDGDHHSHLALQMTDNLCGTNPVFWHEAEQAVIQALQQRINLWNAAYRELIALEQPAYTP